MRGKPLGLLGALISISAGAGALGSGGPQASGLGPQAGSGSGSEPGSESPRPEARGPRPFESQTEGSDLIGTTPPSWEIAEWIGSPPLTLAGLRGKVVLVRWFMSPDCPYCHATAPALNQFHRDYARRGLVVVGMYHHKSDEPLTLDAVRGWVRDYGFSFPVGVDRDWRTLRRWWLTGPKRGFTSVSFLIDRRGVIRQIHPGGTLGLGTPDFRSMQAKIEELLAE